MFVPAPEVCDCFKSVMPHLPKFAAELKRLYYKAYRNRRGGPVTEIFTRLE
jgi:hypothetical protein